MDKIKGRKRMSELQRSRVTEVIIEMRKLIGELEFISGLGQGMSYLAEHTEIIAGIVNKVFNVDLFTKLEATREIRDARYAYAYLLHKHTNLSLKDIGAQFGRKDHSLALYRANKARDYIDTEPVFAGKIQECNIMIENIKYKL